MPQVEREIEGDIDTYVAFLKIRLLNAPDVHAANKNIVAFTQAADFGKDEFVGIGFFQPVFLTEHDRKDAQRNQHGKHKQPD